MRLELVETAKQLAIFAEEKEKVRLELAKTAAELKIVSIQNELVINAVKESLLVLDKNMTVLSANNSFYSTFKVTESETIGKNIFDLGNGQWNIPELKTLLEAVLPTRKQVSSYLVTHNFETIGFKPMLLNSAILFAKEDKVNSILLTIEDITEEKQKEGLLTASEFRYRRLFESAKDGILLIDFTTGIILDVNQFLIDLLGYTKSDFLKKYLWDVGIFKDIVASKDNFPTLQKMGYISFENLSLETKTGKKIEVEFVSNAYEVGVIRIIQCNIRDISARKAVEKKLQESENRFHSVLENMSEGVQIFDAKGDLIYQNSASLSIYGFEEQMDERIECEKLKATWKAWDETGNPLAPDEWPMSRIFRNGHIHNQVLRVQRVETGHEFWANFNGATIYDTTGKPVVAFITIQDITELKKNEERLKELDKLKDDFLSITTHELRTPLVPIKSQIQLLLAGDYGAINPEQKRAIEMIYRNEEVLNTLTGETLDIAKIKSNKFKIILDKVDFGKIISDVVDDLKIQAEEKQLTLTLLPLPEIPQMMADKIRLTQVMNNLLDNAIKFTPQNGTVSIEVKNIDNEITVTVKDTGIGITSENIGKLFTPFFQIESDISRKYRGTGLGLAISKGIIEAHQGKIWAQSDGLGKGSSFIFVLPIVE